ncbi:type V CRISPR-associated endonuclease Cas1 [Candidatus Peregrinibacteria bacterium]|nr:MAG: type V CRISPR-associated endonuclease Cas1 [Candidatus Peregrinibacteria bacterium]
MLSYPDFCEKQILFLSTEDARHLRFQNNNLILEKEKEILFQLPFHRIFALFVIGHGTFSSVFLQKIIKNGVALFFVNQNFRVYAALGAKTEGNTLLRKRQYLLSDSLPIARHLVHNKIKNQLALLQSIRKKTDIEKKAIADIREIAKGIPEAKNNESLLGIEGSVAKLFFGAYFREMSWHGRKPRTKFDPANTLLDMGYTILFHILEAHLRLYGFDIYCGVYHQFFYERKSLVCDMVEPFRCLVDRALRNAYGLKQIDEKDFDIHGHQYMLPWKNGGKYARIFTNAIVERKEDIFRHVQSYYRCFIRDEMEKLPVFSV